jgi:RNA polymerase sigma-70 factor, ECF subfamily
MCKADIANHQTQGGPMAIHSAANITQLLQDLNNGDQTALEKLIPLVEQELHRLAHRYLSREQPGHTLQTTALVNEAYLRLVDVKNWQNRTHFFAVSAQIMRRILVDYARQRPHLAGRRPAQHVPLDEALTVVRERSHDLVALDDALRRLAAFDQRKSRLVELRFFGGFSVEETAQALKLSPRTVAREWEAARAWLYHELNKEQER